MQSLLNELEKGLHEDNLRNLIRRLGRRLQKGGSDRVRLYLVESVLRDILENWIADQPVPEDRAQLIERTIIPPIRAVLMTLESPLADAEKALEGLVAAYFRLVEEC